MADSPNPLFSKITSEAEAVKQTSEIEQMRERLEHYREKSHSLESRVAHLLSDRGHQQELLRELTRSVVAADPYPRVLFSPGEPSNSPVAPVMKVSDWQIGEQISADETEGFGGFNFDKAKSRVFEYAQKTLDWVSMHRNGGYRIPELHIFSEADHVSGNIHYELEVTNEFTVMEATANAGLLLGEMIAKVAAHFHRIVVHEMSADNHGRLTRKNQWKQGAKNNYSWLVHVIANAYLKNHQNVEVRQAPGSKTLADVLGKRFLLSHGHSVQMWNGIPYYGLERERAREAIKRMNTNKTFDYMSIGHFHVPAWINGILINGNLPGTTEFDHAQGRHSPPSQVTFMVHPKHGVFNFTAWKLK